MKTYSFVPMICEQLSISYTFLSELDKDLIADRLLTVT